MPSNAVDVRKPEGRTRGTDQIMHPLHKAIVFHTDQADRAGTITTMISGLKV
jgi:hypothetical protein